MHKPAAVAPIVIYDDGCGPCTRFARAVQRLAAGGGGGGGDGTARPRLEIVGHNTARGAALRAGVLRSAPDAANMFWFVGTQTAYGGRSALLPLALEVVRIRLCGARGTRHGQRQGPAGRGGMAASASLQPPPPPPPPPAEATAAAEEEDGARTCGTTSGAAACDCKRGGMAAAALTRMAYMLSQRGRKITISITGGGGDDADDGTQV